MREIGRLESSKPPGPDECDGSAKSSYHPLHPTPCMTTDYENLGSKVFGHSRWCHLRSPLWFPREKYNHKVLKEVVQGVVNERVPKVGTFPGGKTFAFDENRCRV